MDRTSQPPNGVGVSSADSMRLQPGARIGRYQILRHLATGGMAEVYLASQSAPGGIERVVVFKRVRPHLAEDPDFREMFFNEARLGATLGHSNLVGVIDFGTFEGWHYGVLEYVHGHTLRELLRAHGGALPMQVALTIAREVGLALDHLHGREDGRGRGLVHRDVSPSNIMVSFAGEVKLLDLGIAREVRDADASSSTQLKGKVHYMAPEQVRGETLDGRTDLFALGLVLFELTTATRYFRGTSELALLNRVAEARLRAPSSVVPDYPEPLEAFLRRALARQPDDRFESARVAVRELERVATQLRCSLSPTDLGDFVRSTMPPFPHPRAALSGSSSYTDLEASDEPTVATARPPRKARAWAVAALAVTAAAVATIAFARSTDRPMSVTRLFGELDISTPPVVARQDDAPSTDPAPSVEAPEPAVEPQPEPQPVRKRRRRPRTRRPEPKPEPSSAKIYLPPSRQRDG